MTIAIDFETGLPIKTLPLEGIQMLLTALVEAGLRPELYSSTDNFVEWEIDCGWVGMGYDGGISIRMFDIGEYTIDADTGGCTKYRIALMMEAIEFFTKIHSRHWGTTETNQEEESP